MAKPTPTQARFLQLVYQNDVAIFLAERKPPHRTGFYFSKHPVKELEYQPSTVLACRREGWLHAFLPDDVVKAKFYSYDPSRAGDSVLKISPAGVAILSELTEADFISPPRQGPSDSEKTLEILEALRKKHPMASTGYSAYPPKWVALAEVNVATGFSPNRIDFWALNCWPSQMESVGYEIKVSRGDWLRELADPEKRRAAMGVCNTFYFVAPKGMIKQAELPEGCGLMEWNGKKLLLNHPAPRLTNAKPTWRFLASVARHALQVGARS